jgi:branched-chain amino acid transport system permease protein
MNKLIEVVLSGISNGCMYGLIAIGYSLVYSIIGLINFAHGDVFMTGAFFALTLIGIFGITPDTSIMYIIGVTLFLIISTSLFCGALNYLIYKLVYKPLSNASKLILLVSALGVSIMLQNIGMLWGGIGPEKVMGPPKNFSAPKNFPDIVNRSGKVFGENFPIPLRNDQLVIILITIPSVFILNYFVKKTRTGKAMRACEQDIYAARLMGINPTKVISVAFFTGGFLAGTASVISCYSFGTLHFQMGYTAGLYSFTAAVVGGIGSVAGAMLGGLLLGFVKTVTESYFATQWVNTFVFFLLIIFLIFKPSGILGYKSLEG